MDKTYELLTKQIESFFRDLKTHNPFYKSVFSGTVEKEQIVQMLRDLTFLTANTPKHLKAASAEAKRRKDKNLANYFAAKAGDEDGHDKWGENDVKSLTGSSGEEPVDASVSSGMRLLVRGNREMIGQDPFKYFVYILFAEYFTVHGAPEFLKAVKASCGIPEEYMSIIANHAELDKLHVREWEEELKSLGSHGFSDADFQAAMREVCERYNDFACGLAA